MTPLTATLVAATPVDVSSRQPPVAVLSTHARVTNGGASSGSTPLADTPAALSLATKAKAAAVPDFHHFVAVGASTPLAAPAAEATAAPVAEDMTPLTATPVAATPVDVSSHQPPVAVLTTHARVTNGGSSSASPALAAGFPLVAGAPVPDSPDVAVGFSTPLAAPATEITAAPAAEDLTPLADTPVALSLATKAKAAAVPDFHHFVAVDSSTPLAAPAAEAIAAPDAEDMTPLTATPAAATPVEVSSH